MYELEIFMLHSASLHLVKVEFLHIVSCSLSHTGTGMMVQNGSSSTLSSHPLHLLTVLVLLTLVLFSGLWSQPICGLFTFNGLKLKLSFVSVCVLGRGGFQRAGKVVALQGWEGWDRKEGFQFSFLFFSFYKWNQGGSFFVWMGWKECVSRAALSACVFVYQCE